MFPCNLILLSSNAFYETISFRWFVAIFSLIFNYLVSKINSVTIFRSNIYIKHWGIQFIKSTSQKTIFTIKIHIYSINLRFKIVNVSKSKMSFSNDFIKNRITNDRKFTFMITYYTVFDLI